LPHGDPALLSWLFVVYPLDFLHGIATLKAGRTPPLSSPACASQGHKQAMPLSPDDGTPFNPKWFVIGFALIALALIATYDLRLGIAAGAVLGSFGALWLYFVLKFDLASDEGPSDRRLLLERTRQQLRNRRQAATVKDDRSGA
jgi:hypothetical protein